MADQCWKCSVCRGVFDDEKQAEFCERQHLKVEAFTLKSIHYEPSTSFRPGALRAMHQTVPSSVQIRFGFDQFAYYKLDHIGHRGI